MKYSFSFNNSTNVFNFTGYTSSFVPCIKTSQCLILHNFFLAIKNRIGWREKARRMLLYASDINFHQAGDGRVRRECLIGLICLRGFDWFNLSGGMTGVFDWFNLSGRV